MGEAYYLLANRGYDTDNVIEQADSTKMEAVNPPKKNRKTQSFSKVKRLARNSDKVRKNDFIV